MKDPFKDKNKSCFICSKQFDASEKENGRSVKTLSTPCDHLFHRVCLRNWFRNESNGNWCPHCKRSMEWRDATPPGKESTTHESSSRTNSQSEPEPTVQSLDAEIRQRKAQELLQKKQDAERAKFEVSDEQRAENLERKRLRREARAAALAEQNRESVFSGQRFFYLMAFIGFTSTVALIIMTGKRLDPFHLNKNNSEETVMDEWEKVEKALGIHERHSKIIKQLTDMREQLADKNMEPGVRSKLERKQDKLIMDLNRESMAMSMLEHGITEKDAERFQAQMERTMERAKKGQIKGPMIMPGEQEKLMKLLKDQIKT